MPQTIGERAVELLQLQKKIKEINLEIKEKKIEIFSHIIQRMGPKDALASGAVTVNLPRVYRIFR
jgi:hypothetical protein